MRRDLAATGRPAAEIGPRQAQTTAITSDLHGNTMNIRCLPWFTPDCITFLNNLFKWYPGLLDRSPTALEIGGGNSTLYFLSKGCSVLSIESNDDCIATLIPAARSFGFTAQSTDWEALNFERIRSAADPTLLVIKAESIEDIWDQVWALPWDFILNDGISRHECLQKIVAGNRDSIVILENAEYCANWGSLQRSSAYPPRIRAYREYLRSADYTHYLFEQGEGRSDRALADALGWEAPCRWISGVGWRRSHILSRLMVTHLGFPLVNMEGVSDEDVESVRIRCPYNPDSLEFKNTLHLERSFD